MSKKIKVRNFVQAHVQQFCKPQIFENKRDLLKKGYRKHKVNYALTEQGFADSLSC
ncbi:MAG: hypothetical protein K6F05_04360 [Succinivibrio sp.]|nr:hypothetical protein [Succinivibrio sp.]